jgi:hypothetical protein
LGSYLTGDLAFAAYFGGPGVLSLTLAFSGLALLSPVFVLSITITTSFDSSGANYLLGVSFLGDLYSSLTGLFLSSTLTSNKSSSSSPLFVYLIICYYSSISLFAPFITLSMNSSSF